MGTTVSERLLSDLKANGADFFVSVPCKLLGGMIDLLQVDGDVGYVPATREEEGLGICAGGIFGWQDAGIGDAKYGGWHVDHLSLLARVVFSATDLDGN